jgi:hypothetical protein
MRNHQANLLDAAADLRRCIYASLSPHGFSDPNVVRFLNHANHIISATRRKDKYVKLAQQRIEKAQKGNLSPAKRREDLLTAAILLQSAP